MGASLSKILSGFLWTKKEIRILILGLVSASSQDSFRRRQRLMLFQGQCRQDDSFVQAQGKYSTRLLVADSRETDQQKKIGEVVTTIPTIGFNVESVTYQNLNFNVWV